MPNKTSQTLETKKPFTTQDSLAFCDVTIASSEWFFVL